MQTLRFHNITGAPECIFLVLRALRKLNGSATEAQRKPTEAKMTPVKFNMTRVVTCISYDIAFGLHRKQAEAPTEAQRKQVLKKEPSLTIKFMTSHIYMLAPPCKTYLLCKFKSRFKNRIQCTWKRVIPADRNRWLSLYGPSASQVSGDSQGTENQQKHRQKHRTYTSQMTRDSQDTQHQKS